MIQDPISQSVGCRTWQYVPGQLKVSQKLAYDTPPRSTGAMIMDDNLHIYVAMDPYSFKLVGKR